MASACIVPVPDGEAQRARELEAQSASLRRSLARYISRKVNDPSEVEDLVQEVFVRVAQRGESADIQHLSGYLFQTARSVLADRHRRRAARMEDRHVPFEPNTHGGEEIDTGRQFEAKAELRSAAEALLGLPERTRTIFLLKRLEGLRHRDIADQLGISVSAVEKHMLRAITYLAAKLGTDR